MKKSEILWIICVVIAFFSMLALVLKFLPYDLNSDSAFFPLLAHWEYATGSIFPEGMCYSTQVMGLSPNLFMLPYLAVFGERYLLVRTLGIFTIWIIIIVFLLILFRGKSIVPACTVCLLLLIPYIGSSATEEYFFEAGYVNQIKWLTIGLILYTSLWKLNETGTKKDANAAPPHKSRHIRKSLLISFLAAAVIVYSNSCGFRNILISFIPMTGAVILYAFMKNPEEYNLQETPAAVFFKRVRSVLPFVMIFLAGSIGAFIVYRIISTRVWGYNEQTSLALVPADLFMDRILKLIESLLSICGNNGRAPLFSVRGISKLINYFYAAFLFILVPWYSVRNFGNLRDDRSKLIILTAHISSFLLAFLCVTADLGVISNDESRYCLPIFVNSIFILGALLRDGYREMQDGNQTESPEKRNTPIRLLISCLPVLVVCYMAFSHLVYWKVNLSEIQNLPDPYRLTKFLEEHGLTHGYAGYWNAHKNTILSDCRVEVCGVRVMEHSVEPYNWLTNMNYYSGDYYDGPTFLILTESEAELFDAQKGAAKIYGKPEEQMNFEDLTIYLYDYNIMTQGT